MPGGPAVAPLAKGTEAGASHVFCHAPRCNRHQAAGFEIPKVRKAVEKLGCFGGISIEAGLGLYGAELDLDQDRKAFAQVAGSIIEPFRESYRIDRINTLKEF